MPSVVANKAAVIIEWPAGCEYWREPVVASLLSKHSFESCVGGGCAFGLRSQFSGGLIHKKWRFSYLDDGGLAKHCSINYRLCVWVS